MSIAKTQTELKERIARGLNFGIEAMEEVLLPESAAYDTFILIKSKYNDLMHFSSINVLPYAELEVGFDRIRQNLLKLVQELAERDLEKDHVEKDLKSTAQPTIRANFFQLLDLYYRNLGYLTYTESFYNSSANKYDKDHYHGREAVYKYYSGMARRYSSLEEPKKEGAREFLRELFLHEIGMLEVYLKNIHHLMRYVQQIEVDRDFYINTLKSSLSRFEMAMLFYYAFSEVDPRFTETARSIGLFDQDLGRTLFEENNLDWLPPA